MNNPLMRAKVAQQLQNQKQLPKSMRTENNPAAFGAESSEDYYIYPFNVASIAPAANATASIQIQANSAFVIQKMAYMVDNAAASQNDSTRLIPLVTVKIEDSGSGRFFQKDPIPLSAIAGTGELPFVLPRPRLCMPSSALTATFTNYDAAVTYTNLYLLLIGYQIYNYG